MAEDDIRKSLQEQFMEEEQRELIFNQVRFKELLYQKRLARRKLARTILFIGLGLILAALTIFLVTYFNGAFPLSIYLFYTLLTLGFITFMGGMVVSRR